MELLSSGIHCEAEPILKVLTSPAEKASSVLFIPEISSEASLSQRHRWSIFKAVKGTSGVLLESVPFKVNSQVNGGR